MIEKNSSLQKTDEALFVNQNIKHLEQGGKKIMGVGIVTTTTTTIGKDEENFVIALFLVISLAATTVVGMFLLTKYVIGVNTIVSGVDAVLDFILCPAFSLLASNPAVYFPLFFGLLMGIFFEIAAGKDAKLGGPMFGLVLILGGSGWLAMALMSFISLLIYPCSLGAGLGAGELVKHYKIL